MYLHKILQREMDLEKTIISAVKRNSWVPNCEQRLLWELRKTEKPSLILKRARNVNVYDTMTTGYDLWYPTTTYCLISCLFNKSLDLLFNKLLSLDQFIGRYPADPADWPSKLLRGLTSHEALLEKRLRPSETSWLSICWRSIIINHQSTDWFPLVSTFLPELKQTKTNVTLSLLFANV